MGTSLYYRVRVCTKTIVNHLHREVARIISEVVCWWPCHSSYIFTYFDWILPKTHKSIRNGKIDNPKMNPKLRSITTRRILNVWKHSLESVYILQGHERCTCRSPVEHCNNYLAEVEVMRSKPVFGVNTCPRLSWIVFKASTSKKASISTGLIRRLWKNTNI